MSKFSKNRLIPKPMSIFTNGYKFKDFRIDMLAGLTVAVEAFPLAMTAY